MRARVKSQSIAIYDSAPSPFAAIRNDSIYNCAKTEATSLREAAGPSSWMHYRFPIQDTDT
jgi:hypothetical protein